MKNNIIIKALTMDSRNEILRMLTRNIEQEETIVSFNNIGVRNGSVFYTPNNIKCVTYRTKTSLVLRELK